jgi:hypothetical protein
MLVRFLVDMFNCLNPRAEMKSESTSGYSFLVKKNCPSSSAKMPLPLPNETVA